MPRTLWLSWGRILAVLRKELIQLRRDRLTFAMLVGVPLMQLVLFGYAINGDPRHLPTAVVALDDGPIVRSVVSAVENSGYFRIVATPTEAQADELLARGEVQFALVFPADFTRRLLRGETPVLAVLADATDPAATGQAVAALAMLPQVALRAELTGALALRAPGAAPFEVRVHKRYNPEGITAFNVVPGLMGVILTMTLVMMTSMAMTRERERGTLENLLATPVRPLEMMVGKILPYVLIGYGQVLLVYAAARLLFQVPMAGSFVLLSAMVLLFIVATLAVGFTFSTIARSQMQSMQMTMFYFLPNMLLSGFMFPFRGMPPWAQAIGEVLPLTHFLRIVRAVMLKGSGLAEVAAEAGAIALFALAAGLVAMRRYRQTID
ncbi:mannose-1-phosphate guanyltransferase [Rubrivivax gelatinosus]|uniref:Mannose-1-phosphate guanyltransferase n=1 Tax=Rubrivivax gelatinosus TaxID=28068 RepID=A0ABS1E352_RUBGE|nr:ABC transporter permease [Rubrivivax gelatinosus]MBK1612017.1 mannose-1-phosphate guanyltransferase [Rubrivivax gelatinosus]MBK1715880.1 mannose-1-phosphate guanyltransferase [Rubrivivax gelatinosus]